MKATFITGGSRSGKSSFAVTQAMENGTKHAYIATAQALDREMELRIEKHKKERSTHFDTIEEPILLSHAISNAATLYDIIVVDCLTLWLSNLMMMDKKDILEKEFAHLISTITNIKKQTNLYVVSNEVGMGIVPDNALARLFRDNAGILNQQVASVSDEVYFMVSGLPLLVKKKE
ncbi:MAG: bifunctional adenosylcobinamide kinase/adenosylcobinamide-phosphate guanylyltransferase [Candidatus Magnetoovum sp. WYHC-5]|nr:bifunctional adenosylcobinamide kinase/adenosylcobinamide-phosphate guanylyltransferase [Candidatus Magnetoovum sp. WYHC-5]